jgi:ribosomal-protein-alanine N-acetyltransferase
MRRPPDPTAPSLPPPPSPLTFRRMNLDDLDRVMAIEKDGFAHPWSADLIRRELVHDWSTILLAIELRIGPTGAPAEAIVGFVVYWLVHDELHVLNLATAVERRRQGIARALMLEASARARAGGAVLATLEVRRSNLPALALYKGLGYRQTGIRQNYYVDEGEDAIVMIHDL